MVDHPVIVVYRPCTLSLERGIRLARGKLRDLVSAAGTGRRVLVTSHNNPDPDAIASSLLLKLLLTRKAKSTVSLAYGGVIGRAENVALLDYTGAQFQRLSRVDLDSFDCIALVDAQPGTGNNIFDSARDIGIVFDHHRVRSQTRVVPFHDIRTPVGATTTLLYMYACAARLRITKRLATTILYALRTETSDMGREASKADRETYKLCYAAADLRALARILHAKVGRGYFEAVQKGIESSTLYGSLLVTRLGDMPYPDVAAEIAEYFLKYDRAAHTLAIGRYGGEVLFSMRAEDPKAHIGGIAHAMVGGLGSAGGHGTSAGGQIPVTGKSEDDILAVERSLVRRLLRALRIVGRRRRRLVTGSS